MKIGGWRTGWLPFATQGVGTSRTRYLFQPTISFQSNKRKVMSNVFCSVYYWLLASTHHDEDDDDHNDDDKNDNNVFSCDNWPSLKSLAVLSEGFPPFLSLGKFKRILNLESHFGEQGHFQKTPCVVWCYSWTTYLQKSALSMNLNLPPSLEQKYVETKQHTCGSKQPGRILSNGYINT